MTFNLESLVLPDSQVHPASIHDRDRKLMAKSSSTLGRKWLDTIPYYYSLRRQISTPPPTLPDSINLSSHDVPMVLKIELLGP